MEPELLKVNQNVMKMESKCNENGIKRSWIRNVKEKQHKLEMDSWESEPEPLTEIRNELEMESNIETVCRCLVNMLT